MERGIHLTNQAALELVLSIVKGIAAFEDGAPLEATWPNEMRDWCLQILDLREEGGSST